MARINEILKRLKKDGWYLHRHGSRHDIYKHPIKKGRVVIPRHPGKELATGTLKIHFKSSRIMTSYSAIIEITSTGYSAYIKELAGVTTVGDELSEVKENIYEALDLYFEDQKHPYEVQFFVDLQQFFSYFKVLNKTAFAKYLGMNTSLFRQYTSGLAPLSDDKLQTISEGLQRLSFELNNLSLLSRTT